MSMRTNFPIFFFSKNEKKQIAEAIREAEKNTSGEIRVHLERRVKEDVLKRGRKIFEQIGMTKTEQRNGVLIFLATKDKEFAVLGDAGINEKVPEGFWNDVVRIMKQHFTDNRFAEGISEAILRVGAQLKEYFPCQAGDKNELPDGISH